MHVTLLTTSLRKRANWPPMQRGLLRIARSAAVFRWKLPAKVLIFHSLKLTFIRRWTKINIGQAVFCNLSSTQKPML